MYLHPTCAVSTDRKPLGILDAWMWAREPRNASDQRGGWCESTRWIESYGRLADRAGDLPETRLVQVGDRECDLLAVMQRAAGQGWPVDLLVRSQHNWRLPNGAPLWDAVQASESLGDIEFSLGARAGRRARVVRQELRLKRVTVGHGGSWCDGCQALQLASLDKIERALTLFMVVSWRIARMMRLGRTCPNLSVSLMFDPEEIRAA